MPEVEISIGGRSFEVACQAGEEQFLLTAAAMLDAEAQVLVQQIGRMPESRLLLMAGLMLADKTAGLEDKLREMQDEVTRLSQQVNDLRSAPPPAPQRIEVPVVPEIVTESLAELAARAEALAAQLEDRAGQGS